MEKLLSVIVVFRIHIENRRFPLVVIDPVFPSRLEALLVHYVTMP
jgi:hypothetical protein